MGTFNGAGGQRPGLRRRGACVEVRAGNAMEGDGRGRVAIVDRTPGTGDQRPAVVRGRTIGRHRGWSAHLVINVAVNSGRSYLLYRGRLKRPHLHCRAEAVAI